MSAVVTAHLHNVVYSINFDNQIHILTDHIWLCVLILTTFRRCVHFRCIITDKVQQYNFNHAVTVGKTVK